MSVGVLTMTLWLSVTSEFAGSSRDLSFTDKNPQYQEPSSFNSRFEYRFIDTNYFKVLKLQNQLIQNSSFYIHTILFAF